MCGQPYGAATDPFVTLSGEAIRRDIFHMESDRDKALLRILLELKKEHGDLNKALVTLYLRVNGSTGQRAIQRDIGVSRSVIRRVLQDWSE